MFLCNTNFHFTERKSPIVDQKSTARVETNKSPTMNKEVIEIDSTSDEDEMKEFIPKTEDCQLNASQPLQTTVKSDETDFNMDLPFSSVYKSLDNKDNTKSMVFTNEIEELVNKSYNANTSIVHYEHFSSDEGMF